MAPWSPRLFAANIADAPIGSTLRADATARVLMEVKGRLLNRRVSGFVKRKSVRLKKPSTVKCSSTGSCGCTARSTTASPPLPRSRNTANSASAGRYSLRITDSALPPNHALISCTFGTIAEMKTNRGAPPSLAFRRASKSSSPIPREAAPKRWPSSHITRELRRRNA